MVRRVLLLPLVLLLWAAATPATGAAAVPAAWPGHLALGVRDAEYGAGDLRAKGPTKLRYHYLSGGADPGRGWQTWADGGGSFVSKYVQDSVQHGFLPAFSLYQLRETQPGASMGEEQGILANLGNRATMRRYYEDVRLFMRKAGETGHAAVLHLEPDIWGYVQRASGGNPAALTAEVASTGLGELQGLPNTAAGFARAFDRLRDRYAPKVLLGYHLSVWGTGEDPAYSDPSDARLDELARSSTAFYRALGVASDLVFAEFADRDSGFREKVDGDGGRSRWDDGDFVRHARYLRGVATGTGRRIVLWQIPVGNSKLDDTPHHYRDNRVETLLGTGGASAAVRRRYLDAGVIGMLFGDAIAKTTCTCDNDRDGKADDGGVFASLARQYYARGALGLPGATRRAPRATRARTTAPRMRIVARASRAGRRVSVPVTVTSLDPARVVLAVQLYAPGAGTTPTLQEDFRGVRFSPGGTRRFTARLTLPAGAPAGTWQVKVGVFDAAFARLLVWRPLAARFGVG